MSALRAAGRGVKWSTGRDPTPHAAKAGAIDLDVWRQRLPRYRRGDVAKGGTAHGLFIRVERVALNASVRGNTRQLCPTLQGVKLFFRILPGGWLLSSPEDRRNIWTIRMPQLPGA